VKIAQKTDFQTLTKAAPKKPEQMNCWVLSWYPYLLNPWLDFYFSY